ncbi:MAG: AAA family ATPase [Microbacteriaceae bacterium]
MSDTGGLGLLEDPATRAAEGVARAEAVRRELRHARRALAADLASGGEPVGHARLAAESVSRLERELDALLADPEILERARRALDERAAVLRVAVTAHRFETEALRRWEDGDELIAHAAVTGRRLTDDERRFLEATPERAETALERALPEAASAALVTGAAEALATVRVRETRAQLQEGLWVSPQMQGAVRAALPALAAGAPLLLIGETGGAKTALAEHLAARVAPEAEFVSGYGDITSAQLVGTHELRAEGGATVTAFEPGPLLRAMTEGKPLILDEVNAMPPEFLKRLNRILQLRPGARFAVQEQAGLTVTIARGFSIIATANEHAPGRYRGIEPLSAELINRFGANVHRVHYPDAHVAYDDYPHENMLLAAASLADESGELPGTITLADLEPVARAAFVSQQVFSGNYGEGFRGFVTSEREYDREPGLIETVIAPRTLAAILEQVALTATTRSLNEALARFLDGVMNAHDRRVLALIFEGQGIAL